MHSQVNKSKPQSVCLALIVALAVTGFPCMVSAQLAPAKSRQSIPSPPSLSIPSEEAREDAVLFVKPTSAISADIGIGYSALVAHKTVLSDIERLVTSGNWRIKSVARIEDTSLHPESLREFPKTTGAFFSIASPVIVNGKPDLRPFLIAFQRLNHFEVNFETGELRLYHGGLTANSNVIRISSQINPGIYNYDIVVNDHTGKIGTLSNIDLPSTGTDATGSGLSSDITGNREQTDASTGRSSLRKQSQPNLMVGIVFALTVGVVIGGGTYFLLSYRVR